MALTCQAEENPKVIKRLNKALGLYPESKDVWNLLEFDDIANKVDDNAAKIDTICKYHPNTTKQIRQKIHHKYSSKNSSKKFVPKEPQRIYTKAHSFYYVFLGYNYNIWGF